MDVSATLTCLGTIFYRKNLIAVALQLLTELLIIRQEEKLGNDHRDTAFTLYNIWLCNQLQGCYEEAIECYLETLRVEQIVLVETHKDISMTMFKLSETYKAYGDLDQALNRLNDALSIEQGVDGSLDPATMAQILNEIGNIHLA